ncbi:hypothetical protein NP493_1413g00003 [Ridgeia piscesae]|uniref:Uncharacterized protein n=1 Tax=Ridgeia piscesae TaxID=27915 RepID=A0AAD9NDE7_RIDPI|nr:hypothetical protein NP493_1413g00003 [Ridgeia piscesae]
MSHVGVRGGDDRQPHVGQTQTYSVADLTTQRPPFLHGVGLHAVTTCSHVVPTNPGSQVQLNPLSESVHFPPFLHVSDAHGITSESKLSPTYPDIQLHWNPVCVSKHVPLFLHVLPSQIAGST